MPNFSVEFGTSLPSVFRPIDKATGLAGRSCDATLYGARTLPKFRRLDRIFQYLRGRQSSVAVV